jgi:nucleoside-diphosphate kinase
MAIETTFIMVKPDGVQRGLVGKIVARFEAKGFRLMGMKMMKISQEMAQTHYGEHQGKPFFQELVDFITASPVVAMAWEGDQAIDLCRTLMGATRAEEAAPGTIRGDFAQYTGKNLVHGSDSTESARRELEIFFQPEDLISYKLDGTHWVL